MGAEHSITVRQNIHEYEQQKAFLTHIVTQEFDAFKTIVTANDDLT